MEFLRSSVRFIIVTIAEALAVAQLDSIFEELDRYGFRADQLVVNNVIKEIGDSPFLQAKAEQQQGYLKELYRGYPDIRIVEVPLFPHEIKGIDRLWKVAEHLFVSEGDEPL
jgi:arsenite-transporting ATPase